MMSVKRTQLLVSGEEPAGPNQQCLLPKTIHLSLMLESYSTPPMPLKELLIVSKLLHQITQ
jgi:hypothetical protein